MLLSAGSRVRVSEAGGSFAAVGVERTAVATDPFENFRRQQEQIRRALEQPLASMVRSQRAIDQAVQEPMRQLARFQNQWSVALQAPMDAALENQRAMSQAMQGPLRAFAATQLNVQRMLEGPIAQITQVGYPLRSPSSFAALRRLAAVARVAGTEKSGCDRRAAQNARTAPLTGSARRAGTR